MKISLHPFQEKALVRLNQKLNDAKFYFRSTFTSQIISFTAPTGSGKTIIMGSLIENIFFGNTFSLDPDAIVVWLSDSPELNEQSKRKLELYSNRLKLSQFETIKDDSFDRESLEGGKIYFLNTQKLSKTSNLTKHSDGRQYTIWETIKNTLRDSATHLYFIIDEAHRGMRDPREINKATSIMQKFIKGTIEDGIEIPPMPIIIGMSATPKRFEALISGLEQATQHKVIVTPDEVRESGLLKDYIYISYPQDTAVDMAILQAAADDWHQKWIHWDSYCKIGKCAQVYPVFIIQVENGTRDLITTTNIGECLNTIQQYLNIKFKEGQVVHAFGETSDITVNGDFKIPYEEPSNIANNRKIRVVFFKESLSTGWDCPRAETMMSFRHASDATYIAQLLGRMIRTPMARRITIDDVLNTVNLFLPYFDSKTVEEIVKELRSSENPLPVDVIPGNIPQVLTTDPPEEPTIVIPPAIMPPLPVVDPIIPPGGLFPPETPGVEPVIPPPPSLPTIPIPPKPPVKPKPKTPTFKTQEIRKAINDANLTTYTIRTVKRIPYLVALFRLAGVLNSTGLYKGAIEDTMDIVTSFLREKIEHMKESGVYIEQAENIAKFRIETTMVDLFDGTIADSEKYDLVNILDRDLDNYVAIAEVILRSLGIVPSYIEKYGDDGQLVLDYELLRRTKVETVVISRNNQILSDLEDQAKIWYYDLIDKYQIEIAAMPDIDKQRFDTIISDGDLVSKHIWRLPVSINISSSKTTLYTNHLYYDVKLGGAYIDLNSWEKGVLEEEVKRPDFVCWLRNVQRASWALCLPYEIEGEIKGFYPDMIIVRKVDDKYVFDILEPHGYQFKDNLAKMKSLVEYAKEHSCLGRIQMIRMDNIYDKNIFKRLDATKNYIKHVVPKISTSDQFDELFKNQGEIMG